MSVVIRGIWLIQVEEKADYHLTSCFTHYSLLSSFLFNKQFIVEYFSKSVRNGIRVGDRKRGMEFTSALHPLLPISILCPL